VSKKAAGRQRSLQLAAATVFAGFQRLLGAARKLRKRETPVARLA
jgi:hypothetical protein